MKNTALVFIILFGMFSCTPNYFILDEQKAFQYFGPSFSPKDYTKYNFNLRPYHYFKNNKKNTALFSDTSQFISKSLLLHLDTQSDILDKDKDYYINQTCYDIDVYVKSNGIDNKSLHEGTEIFMQCASGKFIDGEKNVRYGLLYKGYVGPTVLKGKNTLQIVYFDNLYKVKKKKTKKKFSDKRILAILIQKDDNKIEVQGVIDIAHHNKSSKSEIYNMNELFGSPLWFNEK